MTDIIKDIERDNGERKQMEEEINRINAMQNLIMENSTLGIAFVRNRIFEWVNARLGELLMLPLDKIQGLPTRVIFPSNEAFEQLGNKAYPILAEGKRSETVFQLRRSDGILFWCRFIGKALNAEKPQDGSIWMFEDITERTLAEENLIREKNQLKNLLSLYQHPEFQLKDIESHIIEECIKMSKSRLGFFGYINEDETKMMTQLWSEEAIKKCGIDMKPVEFSLDHAGIWADAIKNHKNMIVNDSLSIDLSKKGYPEGHVSITRFLSIPVIKEGKAVVIATVANKEQDYDENDLLHLSLYLESAWNMIKRKQAEERSQELGKRLSTIIDFLPDATFAIDLSGKVIVWNRAIEEMTGVKAKDMLGKGDYEYGIPFYGKRRPTLIDVANEFIGVSKKNYSFVKKEDRILLAEADVTLKGMPRVLWGTAGPLYDGHGNVAGAIESVRDITEFKQAENELKKYAAEIDDLYNNAPCGYHSLAPDGKFLHINDTELKWLGYERDELIGRKTLFDLLTADSQIIFQSTFKILKKGSQAINREYDVIRKDGSPFQILVNAKPVLDEAGTFLESRSTTFDITELKKIQTELQKKNIELAETYEELKKKQDMIIQQEKMASIGMLAAGIAHEIKNPLAIVLQGIDYLQTSTPNDALMIKVVEKIKNAVQRADIIIKGLLSFARQNYLSLTEQDISTLIDESLVLIDHELRKKNLQVIKQYVPDLPKISIDGNQIKQVFVNVLLNGIDAMSPKGIFTVSVRQTNDDVGRNALEISFKDTGEGIPADKIKNIFDPFYTTKDIGNTGLGLSISKGIIDSHKGIIYAESEIGQGTNIIIKLPIPL